MRVDYRVLGRTGLRVSAIGFGAWAIGGDRHGNSYGPTDDRESLRAIERALELGCNFFDTADVYGHGHSEELLGQVAARRRRAMVIATKVGGDFYSGQTRMNFSAKHLQFAVEQSLKRLQTDYLDLYQLHNPTLAMIQDGRVFEVMDELKRAGKIRWYGVSIFEPEEGIAVIESAKADTIQVVVNLLNWRAIPHVLPMAQARGIGVIAREPLHNGILTGKYTPESQFPPGDIRCEWAQSGYLAQLCALVGAMQFLVKPDRTLAQAALRFVLQQAGVSTTIPGAKTAKQVEENLAALEAPALTTDELNQVKYLLFRRVEL